MKEIAVYKSAPSKSLPNRPGPVQCVRNCTNCVLNQQYDEDADVENVIAIQTFDDLNRRNPVWHSRYQTIQYHLGQIDVLRQTFRFISPTHTLYIVAATSLGDIDYFQKVMQHEKFPTISVASKGLDSKLLLTKSGSIQTIVPIKMICCATSLNPGAELLETSDLIEHLKPVVEEAQEFKSKCKFAVVPVTIVKDHDRKTVFGIGSICIQIMQSYPLSEYLQNARTLYKTRHLVQHLYYDLSHFAPRLPGQLVALLLVYLQRPCGVTRDDLIDYVNWLRKASMELDLHLAFTGETGKAVDFGLLVLSNYFFHNKADRVYIAKDIAALTQYASPIIPNLAYYGILSRAILMLHNRDEKNVLLDQFVPDLQIKVMKDDLIELSQDMAEQIDNLLPCRKPCTNITTSVVASFNSMMTFGKYFRVQEARARPSKGLGWLGDYDSDEEYYLSKRNDPAFKPWVIVTQRDYRLDRMNLFMNVVGAYLEWLTENKFDESS